MQIQGPRTFLARPFWRDYVVAYVSIGFGFLMIDIAASQPRPFLDPDGLRSANPGPGRVRETPDVSRPFDY